MVKRRKLRRACPIFAMLRLRADPLEEFASPERRDPGGRNSLYLFQSPGICLTPGILPAYSETVARGPRSVTSPRGKSSEDFRASIARRRASRSMRETEFDTFCQFPYFTPLNPLG